MASVTEQYADTPGAREAIADTAGPGTDSWPTEVRARTGDPSTSHAAAQGPARASLRRRMVEVLRAFQSYGPQIHGGFYDDLLLAALSAEGVPGSPSGFRTARKDLERAGLIEAATDDEGRPILARSALGNDSQVYRLTDAGRSYVLPS